jgi:hypothetical protein
MTSGNGQVEVDVHGARDPIADRVISFRRSVSSRVWWSYTSEMVAPRALRARVARQVRTDEIAQRFGSVFDTLARNALVERVDSGRSSPRRTD